MSRVRSAESKSAEAFSVIKYNMKMFNVTMKRNLLRHNMKVKCFKCTILKFDEPMKQNVDFTSMQSSAI